MHTPALFSAKAASAMRSRSSTVEKALCSGTRRARLIVRKSRRGTSAPPTPCHRVVRSAVSTLCRINRMCLVRSSISFRCTSIFFLLLSISSAPRGAASTPRRGPRGALIHAPLLLAMPAAEVPPGELIALAVDAADAPAEVRREGGHGGLHVVVCGVMGGGSLSGAVAAVGAAGQPKLMAEARRPRSARRVSVRLHDLKCPYVKRCVALCFRRAERPRRGQIQSSGEHSTPWVPHCPKKTHSKHRGSVAD